MVKEAVMKQRLEHLNTLNKSLADKLSTKKSQYKFIQELWNATQEKTDKTDRRTDCRADEKSCSQS